MNVQPESFISLALLAFVFGVKHGFDADHLATIDALTRYNGRYRARWARLCGLLFSLGHGAVVIGIALAMSRLATHSAAPEWLKYSGAWISILFLTGLGSLNLYAVFTTRRDEVVRPVGIKGRLFGRLVRVGNPLGVALVGALFALSFDTVSQAALFAVAASIYGSTTYTLFLGLLFTLGMILTDGLNGLWIAHLIRRADQTARIASRVMSLAVGGLSLLVAAFGVLKLTVPAVDGWSDGKELIFGALVIVIIVMSFIVALRLARAEPDPA